MGSKWILITFWLLVCGCAFPLYAQYQQDLYFDNVTLESGLNQSSIYAIERDQYGFTWLGTQDGLHRFDGRKAELVKLSPATIPRYRYIKALKIIDNILFIGTTEGLVSLDLATGNKSYYENITFRVSAISQVNGTIWLGTVKGIYTLDKLTKKIKKHIDVKNTICLKSRRIDKGYCTSDTRDILYQPDQNKVWIGTINGLYTLDLNTKKVINFEASSSQPTQLSSNDIRSLFLDKDDQVWVGTSYGLNKYTGTTNKFTRFFSAKTANRSSLSSNKITAIAQDNKGYLWIATQDGVNRSINPILGSADNAVSWHSFYNHLHTTHALLSNTVRSILTDQQGRIWVGTNKGLSVSNIFRNQTTVLRALNSNSQSNYILNIQEDEQHNLWLGSRNGITIIKNNGQQVVIDELRGQSVYAIAMTKNYAWIGTKEGLFQVNKNNLSDIKLLNKHNSPIDGLDTYIYSLLATDNDTLWIGSSYGLFKYNIKNDHWQYWNKEQGLVHHEIYTLNKVNDQLWVGTAGGLSILTKQGHFINYNRENSKLGSDWVFAINQDPAGTVWLATSGGVYTYNPTSSSFNYLGITEGNAYTILLENDESIWFSSNKGLYRYNPISKQIVIYGPEDGFSDIEYNAWAALKRVDGTLLFGGISGLSIINPQNLTTFKESLAPVISSIQLDHQFISLWNKSTLSQHEKPLFIQQNFELDWQTNNFILYLSNPYFALSNQRLEKEYGLSNGQLDLSMISAGEHKIQLHDNTNHPQCLNKCNVFVTKAIHPLLSWWALLCYLSASITLLYFIYRHYFLKKHSKILSIKNTLIEQQKQKLKDNLRSQQQLYLQIQHSMKSPISAQQSFIGQLRRQLNKDGELDKHAILRKLEKMGLVQQNLTAKVDEILLLGKGNSLDNDKNNHQPIYIIDTFKQVKQVFDNLTNEKRLTIQYTVYHSLNKNSTITGPDNSLFNILDNLLGNAIKFAYPDTTITCCFSVEGKMLKVNIKDHGIGIPTNELSEIPQAFYRASNTTATSGTGIGLKVVSDAIDNMSGQLLIKSEENQGTEVIFIIPLAVKN